MAYNKNMGKEIKDRVDFSNKCSLSIYNKILNLDSKYKQDVVSKDCYQKLMSQKKLEDALIKSSSKDTHKFIKNWKNLDQLISKNLSASVVSLLK